jgi:hypothetical protein
MSVGCICKFCMCLKYLLAVALSSTSKQSMEQNVLYEKKYSWPNQGRPIDAAWTLWKEALVRSLGASSND